MSTIDERIVSMKFNNAQFKEGVKSTLGLLDTLKTKLHLNGATKGLENISAAVKRVDFSPISSRIAGLTSKLRLDGATKGLENVNSAAKNVSLSHISSGVDAISQKFSAMGVAGVTAIATITHQAMAMATNLVKSFTVDPIKAGLGEYELKLGSIQTILSNTRKQGTTLKDVTAALDELNVYSDKTIYSFAEMTKSVGLFTNSGMKLKDATAVIKGFSNEAAASGASAEQAAGASVQLSQGIQRGTIRMEEFRSLTNAGMGGANMKSGLLEIATAMDSYSGTGVTATQATKDFTGTLEKGWLTADVMTNYLKIQAGELSAEQMKTMGLTAKQIKAFQDQAIVAEDAATKVKTFTQLMGTLKESAGSGWARSFETIIGDFEEAKTLWTKVNKTLGGMIGKAADARNKTLDAWDAGRTEKGSEGGRLQLIRALSQAFQALMSILKPIHDAFREFFPATTGAQLFKWTVMFKNFTHGLILGKENMDKLKRTFRGVFAILAVGVAVIKGIVKFIAGFFSGVQAGAGGVLTLTASVGDFLVMISAWLTKGGGIAKFFDILSGAQKLVMIPLIWITNKVVDAFDAIVAIDIGSHFGPLINIVNGLRDAFTTLIHTDFSGYIQPIVEFIDRLAEAFSALGRGDISGFFNQFKASFSSLTGLGEKIRSIFSDVFSDIKTTAADAGEGIVQAIRAKFAQLMVIFSNAALAISAFFGGLGSSALAPLEGVFERVSQRFDGMKEKLSFKIDTAGFKEAAGNLSVLDTVGSRLSRLWDGLKNAFSSIGGFIAPIGDRIAEIFDVVSKKIVTYIKGMSFTEGVSLLNAGFFMAFYLMLRSFLKALKGLVDSFAGIASSISGVFDALSNSLKTMQQNVKANIILKIAIAVGILVAAIYVLSKMPVEDIKKAMITLSILFVELGLILVAFSKINTGESSLTKTSLGLILLATAIRILTSAVKELSTLNVAELSKGLIGVGSLLAALTLFTKLTETNQGGLSQGAGLVLLALAIKLLVSSVSTLGKMDNGILIKGILSLGVMLVLLAGIVTVFNNTKGIFKASAGMLILAFALMALSISIRIFAAIDQDVFASGMTRIAIALAAIAAALRIMPNDMPKIAKSLIIIAGALVVLGGVIKLLGGMKQDEIANSLFALGGALGILVIALHGISATREGAKILLGLVASLVVLAAVLKLLGNMSLEQIRNSFIALGGAFAIIVIAGWALKPIIPVLAAFATIVRIMAISLVITGAGLLAVAIGLAMLGTMGAAGIAVLVAGLAAILPFIPALAEQVGLGMIAIAKVFGDSAPILLVAFTKVLLELVKALVIVIPPLVAGVVVLIFALIDAIVALVPKLVVAGYQLIRGILEGIAQQIPGIIAAANAIILAFLNGITVGLPQILTASLRLILTFIYGITAGLPMILVAVNKLMITFITGITAGLPALMTSVNLLITTFLQGIAKGIPGIVAAGVSILVGIINGIASKVPALLTAVGNLIVAILNGLAKNLPRIISAGAALIVALLKGIANKIPDIIGAAVDVVLAIINGFAKKIPDIIKAGVNLILKFIEGIVKAQLDIINAAADLIVTFVNGLAEAVRTHSAEIGAAGGRLAGALVAGLGTGLGAAIRALANEIGGPMGMLIGKMADALGIASPSKVTEKLGIYTGQGFAKGLIGSLSNVQKALDTMNAMIKDSIADTSKLILSSQGKLDRLMKSRSTKGAAIGKAEISLQQAQNNKKPNQYTINRAKISLEQARERYHENEVAIKKEQKSIKTLQTLQRSSINARTKMSKGLKTQKADLISLGKQYDTTTEDLKKAQQALVEAQNAQTEAAKGFSNSFSTLPDIDANTSIESYKDSLRFATANTDKFKASLDQLRTLGMDDTTYQKLLDEGVSAQPFLDQLLTSGSAGIQELNTLNANLKTSSDNLGNKAALDLHAAGVKAAQGLVDGLKRDQKDIETQMTTIAKAMVKAIKKELKIKSPSKEGMEIGRYTTQGIADGLSKYANLVEKSSSDVGHRAIDAMRKSISGMSDIIIEDMDVRPVIAPVLDLSDVNKKAGLIGGILTPPQLSLDTSYDKAVAASAAYQANRAAQSATTEGAVDVSKEIPTFVQNNYSPKALSAIEIYRQTKNQISAAKGALK